MTLLGSVKRALGFFAGIVWKTIHEFNNDNGSHWAAAISFYAVFSIAPLLVVVVAVAGVIFGEDVAAGRLYEELSKYLGADGASFIQNATQRAWHPNSGITATLISLGVLIYGSSRVFHALRDLLNLVWGAAPRSREQGALGWLKDFTLGFVMVPSSGLLLTALLAISVLLNATSAWLERYMLIPGWVWRVADFGVSTFLLTTLFASIFRVLPNTRIPWSDLTAGALATALMFMVGRYLIGAYLAFTTTSSVFGAAGTLAVILLWFFFCAHVFVFGAELTHVLVTDYKTGTVFKLLMKAREESSTKRHDVVEGEVAAEEGSSEESGREPPVTPRSNSSS
ncbi:MAG: YihY/virulence factor BrkB family protein [Myxococcota bacterium]